MASKKKPLAEETQGAWTTGLAEGPVFIDGLSHSLFYLIIATKNSADQYQVVAVGKFGPDLFKVKMYGCFDDWGFVKGSLSADFKARSFLSRTEEGDAGYERYYTNRDGVAKIVRGLMVTRGVTVAPVEGIMKAFDIPMAARAEIANALHPARGGYRPQLPFTPPTLLAAPKTKAKPVKKPAHAMS